MTTTPAPIAPGTTKAFPIPGTSYVVAVVNNSRGPHTPVWKVITTYGNGQQLDAYTMTYDNEDIARHEARRLCHEFHAHLVHGAARPATLDETRNARLDAEAAPTVKLAPAAKGTAVKVTDPGMQALDYAIAAGGFIRRGGHEGEAPLPVLNALAKRGHVELVIELHGRRKVTVGARITRAGRIAHLRANGGHLATYALSA